MDIRPIKDCDVEAVIALWRACELTRPWNVPEDDIAIARANPGSDILVGELDGRIVATAMVGVDGHRGWAYYVAVTPERQGRGLGRQIMAAAADWLRARGAPKIHVMVRTSNQAVIDFYDRLGLELQDCVVLGRRLDGR